MYRHLALMKLRSDADTADVEAFLAAARELPAVVDGLDSVEAGRSAGPAAVARGYTHALVMSFRDAAAFTAFLPHDAHNKLVAQMKPLLESTPDSTLVLNLEVTGS